MLSTALRKKYTKNGALKRKVAPSASAWANCTPLSPHSPGSHTISGIKNSPCRAAAKKEKNFAEADRIRDELAARGVTLIDTPQGTTYKIN